MNKKTGQLYIRTNENVKAMLHALIDDGYGQNITAVIERAIHEAFKKNIDKSNPTHPNQ